jgi:predicted transposase YbfD/YdcC
VLLLALGAVMAGARSYAAIAQWAAVAQAPVRPYGRPPSESTFRRVLTTVDASVVEAALTGWVLGRRRAAAAAAQTAGGPVAERRCVLAVDGKTLRGARRPDGAQVQLLAAYDHAAGLVLGQVEVAGGDEIAAFVPVLNCLPELREVVITADALHCQRAHAAYLHARGGHYLFTVKRNQPTLRAALARLPWAQAPGVFERSRGHGRIESRSIKVIDLDGSPEAALFPHGARAIKVVRRRRGRSDRRGSVETVYAITSMGHRDADLRLLAEWIRSHWRVENRLHWVRDVTEGEDASAIRTGSGPQVLAALRNTAINIIRLRGETNIAAAHRAFSYRPADVLGALTAA